MSAACSSSVSFSEIIEQRNVKVTKEVVVCVVSDTDSGGTATQSKRRLKFDEKGRYRLRAKTQGVERFNPFAKSEPEIARIKQRRKEKRRKELEDDAATPLRGTMKEEENHRDPPSPPPPPPPSPPKRQFKRPSSKKVENNADEVPPKVIAGSSSKAGRCLSERGERGPSEKTSGAARSYPGMGKLCRKRSRSVSARDRSSEREKTPASKLPPIPPPRPKKNDAIHRMFDRASDDPLWKRVRAHFELPPEYKYVRREVPESEGESDDLVAVNNKEAVAAAAVERNEYAVKLEQELNRPFSYRELADKLKSVSEQKPMVKSLELRGQRSVEVATEKEGISYLEHHPDFAEVLKSTDGDEKKLKLLRGFLFWIEHSCMSNSFAPWKKKETVIVID